jgi:DNA-binding CsgD family transcriptional regulator
MMGAENPKRRTKTAKQLADELGVSERSIRNIVAEPRDDYEGRAAEKRMKARQLRAEGASYRQIADELKVSIGSVSSLLHQRETSKAS